MDKDRHIAQTDKSVLQKGVNQLQESKHRWQEMEWQSQNKKPQLNTTQNGWYDNKILAILNSSFSAVRSSLTSHFSPLTAHLSPLTSHLSSLTSHLSLLISLCFLLFALNSPLTAQNDSYLYHVNPYNFIRYDLNELHNFGTDVNASKFYDKVEKLISTGEGKINVVQIGGSHIQAGTFSGQIRTRLQQMNGEMNAGWGFMFPYRISRTNSPYGYYIRYTGSWESCRNVERRKTCNLGVGGIAVTTQSSNAQLTILLEDENELDYHFNKVRVFYENNGANYIVSVDTSVVRTAVKTDEYFDFELKQRVDSLTISIQKNENESGSFTLFGLTTESAPNGFAYHSIGVNGAHVPAFLRCQLFEQQLADLKPDLVILGLGINDAYVKNFSQSDFEMNYGELIARIRRAAPETAIVFITNNDSYMYRRYVNKNGEKVEQSMLKMAKKLKVGVWDMYEVMGGLNSIVLWEKNGLAQRDKIHFTREGYLLLGDLFFNALMQGFEEYELNKNNSVMNAFP